jgi:hypothetical protein
LHFQAVINSLLTGGAALGSSLSGSGNGADKIRSVIAKLMEEYKKTRKGAELTFGMDEDVTKVSDGITSEKVLKKDGFCHEYGLVITSPLFCTHIPSSHCVGCDNNLSKNALVFTTAKHEEQK